MAALVLLQLFAILANPILDIPTKTRALSPKPAEG